MALKRSTISSAGTRDRARGDQLRAVAIGVALLIGAYLMQQYSLVPQRKGLVQESETSLRSLAVTFPRLTLGGFRGLVATALWYQAEDDKNNRHWQELETKYDIIGSLQPYFISVYIYHAWNQAYNLSAQWHDVDTKYKWVLDGLAYLNKGEDYNPNQADLLVEQGHMFFLKIGGAYERIFYRAHWRSDIANLYRLEDKSVQDRSRFDTLQAVYNEVMRVGPENIDAAKKTRDPDELQKLDVFHTALLPDPTGKTTRVGYGVSILAPELFGPKPLDFPYGLSPFYFAYVEYKRVLAAPSQPSTAAMRIVDSWPAMSLRMWCRDDIVYSQDTVRDIFGPGGLLDPKSTPAPDTLDKVNTMEADATDCYRNIAIIAPKSLEEFGKHLLRYPMNKYIHTKHIKETRSYEAMGKAEAALLQALLIWQRDGRKMTPDARAAFLATLPLYDNSIDIAEIWVNELYPLREGQPYNPQRLDSEKYVIALRARKQGIENLLQLSPTDTPDLSFLTEETAER